MVSEQWSFRVELPWPATLPAVLPVGARLPVRPTGGWYHVVNGVRMTESEYQSWLRRPLQ
jgi:hypothetical protein